MTDPNLTNQTQFLGEEAVYQPPPEVLEPKVPDPNRKKKLIIGGAAVFLLLLVLIAPSLTPRTPYVAPSPSPSPTPSPAPIISPVLREQLVEMERLTNLAKPDDEYFPPPPVKMDIKF